MAITDDKFKEIFPERPNRSAVDFGSVPKHVAIIMDGNGRWAKMHGMSRSHGHEAGVVGVREAIVACHYLGVRFLTIYSFSTENWQRPIAEVSGLMKLFATTLLDELRGLEDKKVRLLLIGDVDGLPKDTRDVFLQGIEETKDNDGMTLVFAVNYGGRQDIVHASRSLARRVKEGTLNPDAIDEAVFSTALDTADIPDPDLLIRTSGEMRVSNFLLWQIAYSEFYVTDVLWPDFTRYDLLDAVLSYQGRARRFGGI